MVEEKKKIPKEISQEILKEIFKNLIGAILVMLYFVILNIAYTAMKQERLVNDIKVFATAFLVSGIIVIEKAYKKESGKLALTGTELIFLSLHTLSIMHIITLLKYDFRLYLLTSSYVISIYYVLKAIIIYTKGRYDYAKGLSDISDIVKKEEPIVKEAKRRENKKALHRIEDEEVEEKVKAKVTAKQRTKPKVTTEKPKKRAKVKAEMQETEKKPAKKKTKTSKNVTETKKRTTKKTPAKKVPEKEIEEKPKSKREKTKKEVK